MADSMLMPNYAPPAVTFVRGASFQHHVTEVALLCR